MATRFLIFMIMALVIVRCRDTETFIPNPLPGKFTSSAFVEVRDVNGMPLEGVQINLGNTIEYTDEDGIVYLRNVTMENSTYVTAGKPGFFHGSRRFYPMPAHTEFVKIILLPAAVAGTLHSDNGGSVALSGGTTLNFPADAIMDHNGSSYSGIVEVTAQPISAGDPNLSYKMPGDLIGNNAAGDQQCLASMGMVVVELRSPSGELLQVKTGSKVELRVEVPSQLIGNAPSIIPMWYFDETSGYWKEEGEATLVGNNYVTEVGHFSYWNCDAGFPTFKWGASFVYEDDTPASQVEVCITIIDLGTTRCAYTNEEGSVSGLVASGQTLLMEVKSPCGQVVLSQQIGPFSDSTMLGPFTIPLSATTVTAVSGLAVDCNGAPVTDGYAKIKIIAHNYLAVLDSITGAFSITAMNCDQSAVDITAYDAIALKQSLPLTYGYAPVIDAGTITVCEALTEFVDIEVAGFTQHTFFIDPNVGLQGAFTSIYASDSTLTGSKYFYVNFNGNTPGTYTPQGYEIGFELPTGVFVNATSLTVQVTYYGGVGDYIQGNLTGTVKTQPNGGNIEYPFTGTFSVLRE